MNNNIILYLFSKEAQEFSSNVDFGIRCRMDENIYKCSEDSSSIRFTHSNCVINLSPNKRRTFYEIMRILKPGGRICISDIVFDEEIPIDIKYNEKLRGECIGGAMTEDELFSMIEELFFENIFINKRFLYRNVLGYDFYSITYSANKPQEMVKKGIIYRGPFSGIMADDGQTIRRGRKIRMMFPKYYEMNESFFVFDEAGRATNIEQEMSCSCSVSPQTIQCNDSPCSGSVKYKTGCLVCGADIQYLEKNHKMICQYCKKEYATNCTCLNNHYICDKCHVRDSLELIRNTTIEAQYSDMIGLLKGIRNHHIFPMRGPEHHSLVPAIILSEEHLPFRLMADEPLICTQFRLNKECLGGKCPLWGKKA